MSFWFLGVIGKIGEVFMGKGEGFGFLGLSDISWRFFN